MIVEKSKTGNYRIVLEGAFDLRSGESMLSRVQDDIAEKGIITFDFSNVSSIDSCGLGVLLKLHDLKPAGSPAIRLINAQKGVLKVLRNSSLDKLFKLH